MIDRRKQTEDTACTQFQLPGALHCVAPGQERGDADRESWGRQRVTLSVGETALEARVNLVLVLVHANDGVHAHGVNDPLDPPVAPPRSSAPRTPTAVLGESLLGAFLWRY
jgi:hypothetical protein